MKKNVPTLKEDLEDCNVYTLRIAFSAGLLATGPFWRLAPFSW